jgi:hypothetical protein
MDKVTAISFVLSVARENCGVDIFQELSSIGQDKIEAVDISSPDLPNSLWRIHFGNKSILLKQSSPRQQVSSLEYDSLIAHYQTCPALVPRPYYWSPEQQSILLEDLRDYSVLYEELLNFRVDMPAIRKLSASLGQLHQQSHSASNSMVVRDLMKNSTTILLQPAKFNQDSLIYSAKNTSPALQMKLLSLNCRSCC